MSEKVVLYLVRHGKTMLNTLSRSQGWSDSPLTKEGQQNMYFVGKGLKNIPFDEAYSSDAGRAIETTHLILSQQPKERKFQPTLNTKIREWCFGSHEAAPTKDLWQDVADYLHYPNYQEMIRKISYEDLGNALKGTDTIGWSESYEDLKNRIYEGFKEIAEAALKNHSENILVVSHSLTIGTFLSLIGDTDSLEHRLENGSISKVIYQNGSFRILEKNNLSYLEKGKEMNS